MTDAIRQEIDIPAPPAEVYRALTDAERFAAFTGAPASIEPGPGGALSLFGDRIVGRNVDLQADRRVVQAWRSGTWEDGVYSLVRFDLAAHGDGTRVSFTQTGFPDDARAMLVGGWAQMYWEPMKRALAG